MLSIISKLTFLHNIFSKLIISLPVFFTHNFSKYMNIKNAFYNLSLDQISGDCIEFGIFTGSSFKHTIKTENRVNKKNKTRFFGLDSFEGFPDNDHPFFQDINFKSDYKKAKKIEDKFPDKAFVLKGYFKDTLKNSEKINTITKLKFAHIDCDLYISAIEPVEFIKEKLVSGAYLMIDDFTNIDPSGKSIRELFKQEFINCDFEIVGYFGIDGVIIRYFGSK